MKLKRRDLFKLMFGAAVAPVAVAALPPLTATLKLDTEKFKAGFRAARLQQYEVTVGRLFQVGETIEVDCDSIDGIEEFLEKHSIAGNTLQSHCESIEVTASWDRYRQYIPGLVTLEFRQSVQDQHQWVRTHKVGSHTFMVDKIWHNVSPSQIEAPRWQYFVPRPVH